MHQSFCVYLVDDDEDDQFLLQLSFKYNCPNCTLKVLGNGQELLDTLDKAQELPVLILLDLNMPYMGGFEVLARLRETPAYVSVPVVILTTSNQIEDQHLAQQLRADGFVTKPNFIQGYTQLLLMLRQKFFQGKC